MRRRTGQLPSGGVPGIERLEPRLLLTFDPTGLEQEMLEHINRMRTNPQGELDILFSSYPSPLVARDNDVQNAIDFFEVDGATLVSQWQSLSPVAPVAWNESLYDAAHAHNNQMIMHDQQSHQLPGESGLLDRVRDAGYGVDTSLSVGENIFAFSLSPYYGHAAFVIDWGNTPTGIQDPPGHRNGIMNANYQEVGIGITNESAAGTAVGPQVVTEDFGRRGDYGNPRLLGVIFEDMNENGLYTAGEGWGGLSVEISGTGGTFNTTTLTAGGYQLAVPAGTYTVTVSGGGLTQDLVQTGIVVGTDNVKVDFEITAPPAQPFDLSPGGTIADLTPTFSWSSIPGASRYDLWVNDLTSGQSGIIRNPNVSTNSFTPTTPLTAGHSYLWTVRAVNEDGVAGDWAGHIGFSITLGAPSLLAPADDATTADATPAFEWSAVASADHYDLWVNDLTTGQSGIIRNPNVSGTTYTPPGDLPGGHTFIWTVRAIRGDDSAGEWAPHRQFSVGLGTPIVTAPTGGAVTDDDTPTFDWTAVAGASHYDLWVNDQTTGQIGIIRQTQVIGTDFTPTVPLVGGHNYIWTVRAIAPTGVVGDWAAHHTFSITPGAPSLTAPPAGGNSDGLQPTFQWTALGGASKYDIWMNNLTTGQIGVIRNQNVTSNSFTPESPLTADHRYIWTVRAIGANGLVGDWAAHGEFTARVGAPALNAPSSGGTTIDATPTFDWDPVPGATRYDIWVNDLTTGQSGVIRNVNVATDEYVAPTPLVPDHQYLWTVRAFSVAGFAGNWSPHRAFTLKAPADASPPTLLAPVTSGTAGTPTFQWTEVEGAARYDVWVNNLTTGQSGVIRNLNVVGDSLAAPFALTPGHGYIWTVRAFNDDGIAGGWAAHRTFSVAENASIGGELSTNVSDGVGKTRQEPAENVLDAVLAGWDETEWWT